jgi:hypothetical protein
MLTVLDVSFLQAAEAACRCVRYGNGRTGSDISLWRSRWAAHEANAAGHRRRPVRRR